MSKYMLKTISLILYLSLICVFFINCKSIIYKKNKTDFTVYNISDCPEDGTCFLEIIENKCVKIQKDEFDKSYIIFEENESTSVLKFNYKRNIVKGVADQGYQELIYLNINNDMKEIALIDESLSDVGVIFGRLCFCRENTGYFEVEDGNLKIKKLKKMGYKLDLSFKIKDIPQIISSISETFYY